MELDGSARIQAWTDMGYLKTLPSTSQGGDNVNQVNLSWLSSPHTWGMLFLSWAGR